jgi:hypothetical protein
VIRHVVFFRFRADVAAPARDSALDGLAGLPAVIDDIADFEVGRDVLHLPRSWDAVLVATFADLDALRAYQRHDAHVAVSERLKSLCESIGSVDYPVAPPAGDESCRGVPVASEP